jgi:predicted membrane protein
VAFGEQGPYTREIIIFLTVILSYLPLLYTITLLTNHIFFFYRYNRKMKIVEAIIRVFLFFIGLVMKPILKIIFVLNYAGSYSEKVPAIRNPLCLLSATKLAKMIRNREVSKGR